MESKLYYEKDDFLTDPSLLNRFEKQRISINDILNDKQRSLVENLDYWTNRLSTLGEINSVTHTHNKFNKKDLFIGFDEDETLQSLVVEITNNNPQFNEEEILEKCKKCLFSIAPSDGIIRAELSALEQDEVDRWKSIYFHKQNQDSLCDYFNALFNQEKPLFSSKGELVIISTFSKIKTDIKFCLKDIRYQVYNLSIFKTESQLSNMVKKFFFESIDQVLIIQCDIAAINAKYYESNLMTSSFICCWKRIVIESLEPPEISLIDFLDKSLQDIVNSELFSKIANSTMPFEKILQDELLFLEHQHFNESHKNYISTLRNEILNDSNIIQLLKAKTFEWILENCKNWQHEVALNKNNLSKFTCFSLALRNHVKIIVKQTICKMLYSIEDLLAIEKIFKNENNESKMKKEIIDLWKQSFMNKIIIFYLSQDSKMSLPIINDIEFPFSFYFQLNYYKKYYFEELDILKQDSENIDRDELIEDHIEDFKNKLIFIHPNFEDLQKYSEIYYYDFIRIISSTYSIELTSKEKLDFILRNLIGNKIVDDPFILHIYWWKYTNEILIQLKLLETFPDLITKAQSDFIIYGKLDQYLFKAAVNSILQNIYDDKPWKQDMNFILSMYDKINDSKNFSSNWHLLLLCNDLLKIKSIPLEKIKEIIYLRKSLRKQELINSVIEKIFTTEIQQNKQILCILIKNSEEALQLSIRLKTINDNIQNINSNMAELCYEIIQTIFNKFELNELSPYFKHSIKSIVKQQDLPLQRITSITFLKEFIYKFWKNYFHEDNSLSKSLIKEINGIIKELDGNSFIHAIYSYFTLDLYQQSSFDIKQLEILKSEFTWLGNFTDVDINNLPKFLKPIRKVNFEDFRTFYNNNLDKYSFLSVYFKHHENLMLIKQLYPIVRFVKILSSKLEYHLTRKAAQTMTFHEFIKKESTDDNEYINLKSLFEEFTFLIFGLIEQKDSGIYLCAILDYLIKLHNKFLDDIAAIPIGESKKLVLNKVYFEMEDSQFYLKHFPFKYELFHNSPRILFDIKKILPQEPIAADKMIIVSAILFQQSNPTNLSELLFLFETILSFYELIEGHVANSQNPHQQLISAKAFVFALKRFIYRFLLTDSNIGNLNDIKKELVEKLFPTCLSVSHIYDIYNFITNEIEFPLALILALDFVELFPSSFDFSIEFCGIGSLPASILALDFVELFPSSFDFSIGFREISSLPASISALDFVELFPSSFDFGIGFYGIGSLSASISALNFVELVGSLPASILALDFMELASILVSLPASILALDFMELFPFSFDFSIRFCEIGFLPASILALDFMKLFPSSFDFGIRFHGIVPFQLRFQC
ncbi:hypothetical protein C1645_834986 [Glomus cerebriforme]|uniref:Uncharacterized protein n=1 Tax=Glomus cerebriforme TaxID=658196 RepID=A0A397S8M4_9GLOM|nr:hypothetical protein C1645_834986 [Glomus cerebriforme]